MEARTGVAPSAAQPPTPGEATAIAIAYETFGDPSDPVVLLVMGFGTQMLGWDADLCRLLAARGRYVIRYDNRDCGLSKKLDEHPLRLGDFIAAVTSGDFDRAGPHPRPAPPPPRRRVRGVAGPPDALPGRLVPVLRRHHDAEQVYRYGTEHYDFHRAQLTLE